MSWRRIRRAVALGLLVVVLAACDWTAYLGGPEHHSASDDDGIALADVPKLTPQWSWAPRAVDGQPGSLFSTPATWKGTVFVGANIGDLSALDLATGATKWVRRFGFQPHLTCDAAGIMSSPAVRDDGSGNPLVYLNAPDGYLYELDGRTGGTIWRSVVQIPSTTVNDSFAWSSPTVANGRVYVGITSNCDTPFVRGGIKAFDQRTGALLATAWTMPAGYAGAGVWTSVAADAEAIYVTTGSTYDDVDAAHPSTVTNTFDQYSIVKFDAITLARLGKWTAPAAPTGDPDFGSSPMLFQATINSTKVPMVGACNKDGYFYALRSDTMQLVWKRQVGTAEVPGEVACLTGGVWDGSHLFVAGNQTRIGSTTFPGSVRRLNPSTGAVVWARGLAANPLGSGTINGNGLLAYGGTDWNGGTGNGISVVNAASGALVRRVTDPHGSYPQFAQPIWADGRLFMANTDSLTVWSK